MKTLTKAQRAKLDKLRDLHMEARDAVYRTQPSRNVPFLDCLRLADKSIADAYEAAFSAVLDFERDLAADGRGYFSHGHFYAY